jgi:hypothetical protein
MYKNHVFFKSIVIGVICLFLGMGFQPAVAKVSPEIIDFKLKKIDREDFSEKINNILDKYGHISKESNFYEISSTFIFFNIIFIYLNLLYAVAGLIFLTFYFWIKQRYGSEALG